jgi:hypothetical protein
MGDNRLERRSDLDAQGTRPGSDQEGNNMRLYEGAIRLRYWGGVHTSGGRINVPRTNHAIFQEHRACLANSTVIRPFRLVPWKLGMAYYNNNVRIYTIITNDLHEA